MTRQETFDRAVNFIIQQGKPAHDGSGNCLYRTPEGLRCIAGCLIPDSLYKDSMENNLADTTEVASALTIEGHDLELVACLQQCHDSSADHWMHNFMPHFLLKIQEVAEQFDLSLENISAPLPCSD